MKFVLTDIPQNSCEDNGFATKCAALKEHGFESDAIREVLLFAVLLHIFGEFASAKAGY